MTGPRHISESLEVAVTGPPAGLGPADDLTAHFSHAEPAEGCGYCEVRPLLRDLRRVWEAGDEAAFLRVWALSDGYGEPGTVPPQGYDWSGIRDSSPAAIKAMHAEACETTRRALARPEKSPEGGPPTEPGPADGDNQGPDRERNTVSTETEVPSISGATAEEIDRSYKAAFDALTPEGSRQPPPDVLARLRDEQERAHKAVAAEAAPAKSRGHAQSVVYTLDGKPRTLTNRTFTLGYLAALAVGGKGATEALRTELKALGVDDPEHTAWEVTLGNGKRVGAVLAQGHAPAAEVVLPAGAKGSEPPAKAEKKPRAKSADEKKAGIKAGIEERAAARRAKAPAKEAPAKAPAAAKKATKPVAKAS